MAEIWRKLYRCVGLFFPILYFFSTKNTVLIILSIITFIFILFEILRFKFPVITKKYFEYVSAIAKKREKKNISGTTYVLVSSLLTILFFEKSIAIAAIFFLIFGDGVASLVGKIGRIKIFNKTLEGSLACFVICLIIGIILLNLGLILNYYQIIFGSLAATLIELIPLSVTLFKKKFYIDDNLSMAIVSGLVMALLI